MKYVKYSNMPVHLRWDLYPVPHEGHKAHYGGSYFEEVDWWKKPRHMDKVSELKHMVPEMAFLVAVKEHNPSLWLRTFPFHFGMYCLIGCLALLVLGAVMELAGLHVCANANAIGATVHYGTGIVGLIGAGLGTLGALGLLARRLFDENLKDFTKPSDIFNLLFLLSIFVLILILGIANPSLSTLREYVRSVMVFNLSVAPSEPAGVAAVILASLAVAYIPLTHMSHFVIKWFTYHKIRWDDEPNLRGGAIEGKVMECLNYPVSWSADHVQPKGEKRTWAQIATEPMPGQAKKESK
ncbi:MAG: respiratory nitrate reductase subunit gamma [Pseudomonadota bacterium]